MHKDKLHEMNEKEESYWWFAARKDMILSLLKKYAKPGTHLLDAGCGTGLLAFETGKKYKVTGLDIDPIAIAFAKKRKPKAKILQMNLEKPLSLKQRFDTICITDVLEHVHDKKVVKNLSVVLRPNGIVIATVPAYPFLYSYWDKIHMHKRRYTANKLQELFIKQGFEVVHLSFFNSLLFPIILGIRVFKSVFSKGEIVSTDCFELPKRTNSMLFRIFKAETQFAVSHKIPFGLSLLLVAKKL